MPLILSTSVMLSLMAVQPTAVVGSGPEPAPLPVAWELDFRFLDPQRITVQLPGEGETRTYWYMVYTVVNRNDRTHFFYPTFELVTDELDVIQTDMGISPLVFQAIKERHRITHPYLVSPTEAVGELLTGVDNALESVAIWRDIDPGVNQIRVYVSGLSGETRFMPNPAYDPDEPTVVTGPELGGRVINPKHFTLRKTLEIGYNLPGSPAARGLVEPERTRIRWIMR